MVAGIMIVPNFRGIGMATRLLRMSAYKYRKKILFPVDAYKIE